MMILVFPNYVKAEVKATDFAETISEEIATFDGYEGYEEYVNILKNTDLSNYEESTDKINVYIFRGSTCSYCLKAVSFFASIVDEYGQYFNLVTYEVWANSDNASLMDRVAATFDEEVTGVPYIVIGDQSYPGYINTMDDELKEQIVAAYKSTDRYDVMNNLGVVITKSSNNAYAAFAIALEIIIAISLVLYINNRHKIVMTEIDTIKTNQEKLLKKQVSQIKEDKAKNVRTNKKEK